jgi:8-hydroxy-5-deazaflavin:NADPH oxidoreductase
MRTAILGLGNIGSTVATNLTAGGGSTIVSDKDSAKAQQLAMKLGASAEAMPMDDALEAADVIVLTIWFDAIKEFVAQHREALSGKILVDPSNPIAPDEKGGFKKTIPEAQSSGAVITGLLPRGAKLVKAFGTLSATSLASAANRSPERAVLFYATDHHDAGDAVAELIRTSGFTPVRVGGIDQSIRIEVGGDLHEMGGLGRLVSAKEAEALIMRQKEHRNGAQPLSVADRFEIFEQLQRHQRCIDKDASRASAMEYVDLYWPEATFTVHDLRHNTFEGPEGLKRLYDYAHSVFPLHKWFHSVGSFEIRGAGDTAEVFWRWVVSWRYEESGTVSTGTYEDRFERRDGIWKCRERVSNIDPNWPAALFQPWVDSESKTFKAL